MRIHAEAYAKQGTKQASYPILAVWFTCDVLLKTCFCVYSKKPIISCRSPVLRLCFSLQQQPQSIRASDAVSHIVVIHHTIVTASQKTGNRLSSRNRTRRTASDGHPNQKTSSSSTSSSPPSCSKASSAPLFATRLRLQPLLGVPLGPCLGPSAHRPCSQKTSGTPFRTCPPRGRSSCLRSSARRPVDCPSC